MKCKFCGKGYNCNRKRELERFNTHVQHCKLNPNRIKYKCKYCDYESFSVNLLGNHTTNCSCNPDFSKIRTSRSENGKNGRPHTEETKKKISKIRIDYLLKNPDKVPYLLNHSSKESYPEKYFTEIFGNEGIEVVKKFRIRLYELDFCIPEKKIDIEIDGDQHYSDIKIVQSDLRRNKFLEDDGWVVIRINWSEYKKLNFENRKLYIQNLKNKIDSVPVVGRTV